MISNLKYWFKACVSLVKNQKIGNSFNGQVCLHILVIHVCRSHDVPAQLGDVNVVCGVISSKGYVLSFRDPKKQNCGTQNVTWRALLVAEYLLNRVN